MSLTNYTYVGQAVSSEPDGALNNASELDNCIRMDRAAQAASWPNILGPVAASHQDLTGCKVVATGGTASAYTVTISPAAAFSSYVTGAGCIIRPHITNADSPTIDFNSLGAKALVTQSGVAIKAGVLKTTGLYMLAYNGTSVVVTNLTNDISGDLSVCGDITATGKVTVTGDVTTEGKINAAGSAEATSYVADGGGVALRQKDGSGASGKAFLQYKDANSYYQLITNDNDADGSFNSLRPYIVNLSNGNVTMSHNVNIGGTCAVTGAVTSNSAVTANVGNVSALAGDLVTQRNGAANQGIVFLGNTGKYLHFDGVNYHMPGANAYVNNLLAMTVASASISGRPGYITFNNGLKVCWGRDNASGSGDTYVNLPIAFASVNSMTIIGSRQNGSYYVYAQASNTSQIRLTQNGTGVLSCDWLVIGY